MPSTRQQRETDVAKGKERIYRQGLADPRSGAERGAERVAGLVNRVASGNKAATVRRYDDSPSQMAKAKGKKR